MKDRDKPKKQLASELAGMSQPIKKKANQVEELYRKMAEMSPDSIVTLDMKGVITSCNTATARLLGYSADEMVGKHFTKIGTLQLSDVPKYLKILSSVLRGKATDPLEVVFIRKDGSQCVVDARVNLLKVGNKTIIVTTSRDITERKRAEEAQRESDERYRAIVNLGGKIGEAIILRQDTDQGDGIMSFVSDEWCRITGYSKEELLGMSFFDLVHSKYREDSRERYRKRMRGESLPGLFELCIIRKDGTEVPIELTSSHTTYLGKRANVAFIRDITERKKAEAEREKLIKELEEALEKVQTLSGLLPICAWCKKIRDDEGYWQSVEEYLGEHSEAKFSHSICPECKKKYAPK